MGTVLLFTITLYSFIEMAICWVTFSICCRFAEPSSLEEVPTAIKITLDCITAFFRSVVKLSLPAVTFFLIKDSKFGS